MPDGLHPAAGVVALRSDMIESALPLARSVARRFAGRGVPLDDLEQVAAVGLVQAVDRYDPSRGVPFAGFAVPTMVGQIKRHFRDATWSAHVPRRTQESVLHLAAATEDLTHMLHRSPTAAELAGRMGVTSSEIEQARFGAQAYGPLSFQGRSPSGYGQLGDLIGGPDGELDNVEDRLTVQLLLDGLSQRDRRVVGMRFLADMTQLQIAAEIGVSQMQISRILKRCLGRMRRQILDEAAGDVARPLVGRAAVTPAGGASRWGQGR